MNLKRSALLAMLAFLLLALALAAGPAQAGDRVSLGEAESVLHAFGTARIVLNLNSGIGAVQFTDFPNVAIFPSGFSEGNHYCEQDHLVAMRGFYTEDLDYQEAKAASDTLGLEFWIDGQQYDSIRTPVARRLPANDKERYSFSEGIILAPGDLSVGMHTLVGPVYLNGNLLFSGSANFYIDAAGTGACQ